MEAEGSGWLEEWSTLLGISDDSLLGNPDVGPPREQLVVRRKVVRSQGSKAGEAGASSPGDPPLVGPSGGFPLWAGPWGLCRRPAC